MKLKSLLQTSVLSTVRTATATGSLLRYTAKSERAQILLVFGDFLSSSFFFVFQFFATTKKRKKGAACPYNRRALCSTRRWSSIITCCSGAPHLSRCSCFGRLVCNRKRARRAPSKFETRAFSIKRDRKGDAEAVAVVIQSAGEPKSGPP